MAKWHPEGECWISDYSTGSHGYAQIGWFDEERGREVGTTAHRVSWWGANRKPIKKGMTIDHVCHVKRCVNPLHLRLLSNEANAADNNQIRTNQPTGRLCRNGHPMVRSAASKKTYCRECIAAAKRRARAR